MMQSNDHDMIQNVEKEWFKIYRYRNVSLLYKMYSNKTSVTPVKL